MSYAVTLRTPGAPVAFIAATLARLSYGTVSLSLLLTVQTATGSFAVAGTALGAFGLAAVLAPLKARSIDRHGRRTVLTPLAVGYAAMLALVATLAAGGIAAAAPYLALSGAAGLLAPPVGPVMRGIWAGLTPDPVDRQRAYALDAVVEESVFASSPLLVAVVVATSTPLIALAGTALLALAGGLGLAISTVSEQVSATDGDARRRLLGPLGSASLRWVLLVMTTAGVGLSLLELAVVARAAQAGRPAAAGYLLGALSVGSAVGGLLWGRRRHHQPHQVHLLSLLAALAGGILLAALVQPLPALAAVLALTGLAVAPIFVVAYLAADQLTTSEVRTEATTWVATASNLGGAGGAALGGYLIDQTSARTVVFAAAASLALVAFALAGFALARFALAAHHARGRSPAGLVDAHPARR